MESLFRNLEINVIRIDVMSRVLVAPRETTIANLRKKKSAEPIRRRLNVHSVKLRRQRKKAAQFRESLKYEQRIAAFLDVLGWGGAIKQSIKDPMLTQQLGIALDVARTRAQIHEQLKQHAGNSVDSVFPEDPQITHFSDCILVSVAATEFARMYIESELATIVSKLLQLGFLVRGAIVQGALIHKGSLAYGPALVQAYVLESEIARVPRIILDPALAKQWMPIPYVDKDKK